MNFTFQLESGAQMAVPLVKPWEVKAALSGDQLKFENHGLRLILKDRERRIAELEAQLSQLTRPAAAPAALLRAMAPGAPRNH